MTYYEFFVYGPRKDVLESVRDTLVWAYDFDPRDVAIRLSGLSWNERVAQAARSLVGNRRKDDWLMTITGPEIHRDQVDRLIERQGGFCDGGGYSFMYDPTGYYSDEQIERHSEAWQREVDESHAVHLASLTDEEREEYLGFLAELSKMTDHAEE